MMLLALPLEIWELIFELLPGQHLQIISKVPRLRVLLEIARRSAHRLEVHRAGLVDASRPSSYPLAQRVELLKTYRVRWESLRWAEISRLPPQRPLCIYHLAGNVLVHMHTPRASVIRYLRLPAGGTPAIFWEDDQLGLEHGIKTFSAYPEKNLLAVLEEWLDGSSVPLVRLHVRRLDSTRDIVVPHEGQLKVCQPFTTDVDLDVNIPPENLSCEIEQIENHLAILFACYTSQSPGYCAKFIIWDVITQEQVMNMNSWNYRSFVFLDHRCILFGAICNDPNQYMGRRRQPYLEIVDSTNPAGVTYLELDKSALRHTSPHSTIDISVGSGAAHEEASPVGSGGMPFVSDTSRGIITADVYLHHRDGDLLWFESYVFVVDIEDILAKAPSPSDPGHCVVWEDLRSSTAMFSYSTTTDQDRYRIFSRHSYVSGFRYASPIQPLDPEDQEGRRCFFVYDFNPYRESSPDSLPGVATEAPDFETGYPRSASEITREVVGGLSCWRTRFDLPAAGEDIWKCHVVLTNSGVVLFELSGLGEESITVFSMW